jgi:proteasome lid subunit RPN8/RPN11
MSYPLDKKCPYCYHTWVQIWRGESCPICYGVDESYSQTDTRKENSTMVNANDDHWETDIETIHDCSKAPEEIIVKVDLIVKLKIDSLMEEYPGREWLGYLIGQRADEEKEIEADPLHIVDVEIPEQVATSARVEDIECENFNELNVVGVIHSHHGMGTGFSGTDHEFINGNHNLSLVIANNGIAGQYRWTTPCGALKIIEGVKVKVIYPEIGFDKEAWLKEETPKIKKPTPPTYNYGQNYHHGGGWQGNRRQQQYTQGVATPRNNATEATDDDDGWDVTDPPDFDSYQSLKDALNEAFE